MKKGERELTCWTINSAVFMWNGLCVFLKKTLPSKHLEQHHEDGREEGEQGGAHHGGVALTLEAEDDVALGLTVAEHEHGGVRGVAVEVGEGEVGVAGAELVALVVLHLDLAGGLEACRVPPHLVGGADDEAAVVHGEARERGGGRRGLGLLARLGAAGRGEVARVLADNVVEAVGLAGLDLVDLVDHAVVVLVEHEEVAAVPVHVAGVGEAAGVRLVGGAGDVAQGVRGGDHVGLARVLVLVVDVDAEELALDVAAAGGELGGVTTAGGGVDGVGVGSAHVEVAVTAEGEVTEAGARARAEHGLREEHALVGARDGGGERVLGHDGHLRDAGVGRGLGGRGAARVGDVELLSRGVHGDALERATSLHDRRGVQGAGGDVADLLAADEEEATGVLGVGGGRHLGARRVRQRVAGTEAHGDGESDAHEGEQDKDLVHYGHPNYSIKYRNCNFFRRRS
eukprot:PhM_4_TR13587/c0_g1_i1/m.13013